MGGLDHTLFLLGRILLGGFFLWKALEKIRFWDESAQILKKKKVPYIAYLLPFATGVQILGGLSVVLGVSAHLGALLLSLYMIVHIFRFHSYWQLNKGAERIMEQLMFMKDVAILGGLLLLIAVGGGPLSLYA